MMRKYLYLISIFLFSAALSGCMTAVVTTQAIGSNLSVGQQTNDYIVEAKALATLRTFPAITQTDSPCSVDLTVFNGVILVMGQVPSRALQKQIPQALASIPNAKKVYNALTVGPVSGFWRSTADGYLSARVKTALTGPVNSLHFKVITQNGMVYLLGMTTPKEGQLAAKIASEVGGVKKVVTAYWYLQPKQAAVRQISLE